MDVTFKVTLRRENLPLFTFFSVFAILQYCECLQIQPTGNFMKKPLFQAWRHSFVPVRPRICGFALTSVVLLLALSACNKQDNKTVGQKLDSAIEKTSEAAAQAKVKTEQSAEQAKSKTEETLANAGAALKNATQKAEASIKDAAGKASEKMDDFSITTAVSAGIAKDSELSVLKIKVETKNGVVTLNGTAPAEAAREKASGLAKAVQGVRSVDNKLVVKAG